MSGKYIRKNKNSFSIIKNSQNYGKFNSMDYAIFLRDKLIENGWDLNRICDVYKINEEYIVVKLIDDKLQVLAKFKKKPSPETIDNLYKKKIRNPNNSKYGLNINKIFGTYVIKKQIAGDEYIFGYYDNLSDAEFVRNFLLDNNWNVNEFHKINYDRDTDTYKIVEIIKDKAYVLGSAESENEIDIDEMHIEFITKISKHKYGLSSHPELDELKDMISELEEFFAVKAADQSWSFENVKNPLQDIIFTLTPFQKSVYDAIDENSAFEDIKKSLIRYNSNNFDEKILKNLNQLIEMGLVFKNQNYYSKRNF